MKKKREVHCFWDLKFEENIKKTKLTILQMKCNFREENLKYLKI